MPPDSESVYQQSDRPEVALITNHGYAGAEIPIGGAPDTGGQVVYVNALAGALAGLGYRVTIFARGGFPHFESERIRREPEYLSDPVRYVFVSGGGERFIRKEEIAVALDEEVVWLDAFVRREAAARHCPPWALYEFVNTHYWDAAVMGMRLVERWQDDIAAQAVADLLAGAAPPEQLDCLREDRDCGAAPAYHLGAVLLAHQGSPATPLPQRAGAAAKAWAATASAAGDADGETIAAAVENAVGDKMSPRARLGGAASHETDPALRELFAAEALGNAILSACPQRAARLERELDLADRHVWTPHSLAALKEENFRRRPPDVIRDLKFCERRNHERTVCSRTRAFAATSAEMAERLRTHYRVSIDRVFYFPPCIDRTIFRAYSDPEAAAALAHLAELSGIPLSTLRTAKIIFETSRMDRTKRKDLLLDAFAQVALARGDVYLFIGGGPENDLFKTLSARCDAAAELRGRAFLTGFLPEEHIGPMFSIADVYVSASEMEGFGMSVSQAAAAGTAVVSSDLVPFAVQYVPDEAMVVPAGDVDGFARAMLHLLDDAADRERRAAALVEKVKTLDWQARTEAFVDFLRDRGIDVTKGRMAP